MREALCNDILHLREQRRGIMRVIQQRTLEMEAMLNVFALDTGDKMVTFKDLQACVLGDSYPVNDKVNFVKYFDDGKTLKFKCYIKAGGSFGIQKHDCVETTTVISGNLIEGLRNFTEFLPNETIVYQVNEEHKPYSTQDSVLDVVFTKS